MAASAKLGAGGALLVAGALALALWLLWRRPEGGEGLGDDEPESLAPEDENVLPLNWPVPKTSRITTRYGAPAWGTGTPHNGIDLAVPVGTEIKAPADGTVERIWTDDAGGGYSMRLRHGANLVTGYAHLSGYLVTAGQQVSRGQPIATSGGKPGAPGAGRSSGPHLHFVVRRDGSTIDPLIVLV